MSENKSSGFMKFINSLTNLFTKIIWLIILLIILIAIGKHFIFKEKSKITDNSVQTHKINPEVTIPWEEIDKKIVNSMQLAYKKAKSYAEKQLRHYARGLKERTDKNFLDWYFSYWTQQKFGIKGLFYEGLHKLNDSFPGAAEKITEEVQEEFAKRVLRPSISQIELEKISRETLDIYLKNLQKELAQIPKEYKIEKANWEKHLDAISHTIIEVEGRRRIPLSLKALTIGTIAGTYAVFKAFAPLIKKIASKVSAKLAGKFAAKIATKTGAKVAAKVGGKMLGPLIGIGIIIWDIWDHYKTREINEPILRKNLHDYIDLMVDELLNSPDSGVMSVIYRINKQITNSLIRN